MSTVLCSITIPKLFDVVRRPQSGGWAPSINYHVDCDQSFTARWPLKNTGFGVYLDPAIADHFHCPLCGQEVDASRFTANISQAFKHVPLSADIKVVERAHQIDLVFAYDSVMYDSDFSDIVKGRKSKRTDIIRFDFRERKTYHVQKGIARGNVTREIDPFFTHVGEIAPFCFLQLNWTSYLVHHKAELKALVQALKSAFLAKLSKRVGYKVPGIRQNAVVKESSDGALGGVLDNLVWKMVAPDAPAITAELRKIAWERYCQDLKPRMNRLMGLTVSGQSFVQAFMEAFGLVPSRLTRQTLQKGNPFIAAQALTLAHELVTDRNYIRQLTNFFIDSAHEAQAYRWIGTSNYGRQAMLDFLRILRYQYGEGSVVAFITTGRDYITVRDTALSYFKLTRENRKTIWDGTRIQLRDMHNVVAAKVRLQGIESVGVQLTERYTKLSDNVAGFTFSIPQNTMSIALIGERLHNCVRTYCDRVKVGRVAIVEVKRGEETVACLEVTPKKEHDRFAVLSQAKLKNNVPVATDTTVNHAVVEWATKHKLSLDQVRFDVRAGGATA